jgi:hypothetical protein
MKTCSVCGGDNEWGPHTDAGCINSLSKRLAALESAQRQTAEIAARSAVEIAGMRAAYIGMTNRESEAASFVEGLKVERQRLDCDHHFMKMHGVSPGEGFGWTCIKCKLWTPNGDGVDAVESAQRPQPAQHVCDHRCNSESGHHSWPPIQRPDLQHLAPVDATGGDEDRHSIAKWLACVTRAEAAKEADECSGYACRFCRASLLLRQDATRLDELRRERDARLQCTRAWAVANQRADEQKSRADGGRDVLDKLDELRREQGVIAIGDGLRVGRHWVEALQARADAAEAKVDKLTDAIFWALGEGGSDFHKHVGPNQPQYSWRARLRELMKDALTTPAQRSESNDGG